MRQRRTRRCEVVMAKTPPSDCLGAPARGRPIEYVPSEKTRTEPTGAPAAALALRPVMLRAPQQKSACLGW